MKPHWSSGRKLLTWGGRNTFRYTGSVKSGVQIRYGMDRSANVTAKQFSDLLKAFRSRQVDVGTSRTTAPRFSLGAWLQAKIMRTAIASYIAPILIAEGYAARVPGNRHSIQFTK